MVRRGRRPLERAEDPVLLFGRDGCDAIDDVQLRAVAVAGKADIDGFALTVLDCVRHQVRQDLIDARPFPRSNHRRRRIEEQRHVLTRCLVAGPRQYVVRNLDEIGLLELELEPPHSEP